VVWQGTPAELQDSPDTRHQHLGV
jgi:hypothetical protein